jgi:uncharacterized membrane protein YfcA
MVHWELVILFFTIAFLYASVGFGGGSSYLAIMALYAFPVKEMKLIALICNLIVVSGGLTIFIKSKQLNFKKALPLVILSIPMAYLGARWPLKQQVFFILLGCSLLMAGLLLWIETLKKGRTEERPSKGNLLTNLFLGAVIGLLSGLVGIGGGIFLSPLLNLLRWDTARKIAATASLFILVNSISGIVGQLQSYHQALPMQRLLWLCLAVLLGGQLGSRLSAKKFSLSLIKRITAVLVCYAGAEVLLKHLNIV